LAEHLDAGAQPPEIRFLMSDFDEWARGAAVVASQWLLLGPARARRVWARRHQHEPSRRGAGALPRATLQGGSMTTTAPPTGARRRRRDDTRLALAFIAPATLGLLVFYFWPLLRGVWLSFTSWDVLTPARFVGVENYVEMIGDPVFWNAVRVTALYVVINIGVQTVVALLIAVLMQRLSRSILLRSLILTPYLVSNVVAALVFLWILDFQLGIGNNALEWLGLDRIGFFTSATWVIPTIALVNVWRHMGYTALLIFAGLLT